MPEAIRDLLQLAERLATAIPDQTLREVERTVLELTYAGNLSLAYYLDDPDTPDVSWGNPATAIEYRAGWNWNENCFDFDRPPELGSWIKYPSRHEYALALLTSHGVPIPGGFIAWTRKEGTYSSLLPRHVIDELERLSETERRQSLDALYTPFIFGGDDGLLYDGGTIRLKAFALFVDQDAHEAYYTIHAELIPDGKADLAVPSARKAIIRSILLPLRTAIRSRGGFADPESTSLLADFHLRVAPFDASKIPEIIRSFAAAVQGKGHILEFACVVGDTKRATIATVDRRAGQLQQKPKTTAHDGTEIKMPASWFKMKFGIPPARLQSARKRGKIHAEKSGRFWQYSVVEARAEWPEDEIYIPD